jgi:hypothetical protein
VAKGRVRKVANDRYDYSRLSGKVAAFARAVALRFSPTRRKRLVDVVVDGTRLSTVKKLLGHGEFEGYLTLEFRRTARTARRVMAVADWLNGKTDIMSDLRLPVTAAYHLAAPCVPEQARQEAIERALAGKELPSPLPTPSLLHGRSASAEPTSG